MSAEDFASFPCNAPTLTPSQRKETSIDRSDRTGEGVQSLGLFRSLFAR